MTADEPLMYIRKQEVNKMRKDGKIREGSSQREM